MPLLQNVLILILLSRLESSELRALVRQLRLVRVFKDAATIARLVELFGAIFETLSVRVCALNTLMTSNVTLIYEGIRLGRIHLRSLLGLDPTSPGCLL